MKPTRDPAELFPKGEFRYEPKIPVFHSHAARRVTKDGKPVEVTKEVLEETAENNNKLFATKGIPTAFLLGHTKEGENVREEDQPAVAGWGVNYTVETTGDNEHTLYCDGYFRKKHEHAISEFPFRSVEFYPKARLTPFVALLRGTLPELDLPIVRYSNPDSTLVRFQLPQPETDSSMDPKQPLTDKDVSTVAESQPIRELVSKIESLVAAKEASDAQMKSLAEQLSGLMQAVSGINQMLDQLADEYESEQPGDPSDLLGPADPEEQPTDQPGAAGTAPEKFEMQAAGPASGFVPGSVTSPDSDKETVKMAAEFQDEKVLFAKLADLEARNKQYEETITKLAAESKETAQKFRRAEAEKTVAELETKDRVDFKDEKGRQFAVDMLAHLDPDSREIEVNRMRVYYSKKELPNGGQGVEAVKFARVDDGKKTPFESPEDVQKFVNSGLSYADYLKKHGA